MKEAGECTEEQCAVDGELAVEFGGAVECEGRGFSYGDPNERPQGLGREDGEDESGDCAGSGEAESPTGAGA